MKMKMPLWIKISLIVCIAGIMILMITTHAYDSTDKSNKNPLTNHKIKSSHIYPIDVKIDTGDSAYIKEEYVSIFVDFLAKNLPPLSSVDKTLAILLANNSEEYRKAFRTKIWNPFVKKEIIPRYIKFVKKYPKSSLVAEAKLRIVEFYIITREPWKAKKWLDSIINNHPADRYFRIKPHYTKITKTKRVKYAGFELVLTEQHTVAWALYFRATRFPNNPKAGWKKDLTTIITKYKSTTEVYEMAKKMYERLQKHKRRK